MKGGKLIIFSAPSGSGKTTIVRHLLEKKELNLAFSVSATSRPKRGKKNTENITIFYLYLSSKIILKMMIFRMGRSIQR